MNNHKLGSHHFFWIDSSQYGIHLIWQIHLGYNWICILLLQFCRQISLVSWENPCSPPYEKLHEMKADQRNELWNSSFTRKTVVRFPQLVVSLHSFLAEQRKNSNFAPDWEICTQRLVRKSVWRGSRMERAISPQKTLYYSWAEERKALKAAAFAQATSSLFIFSSSLQITGSMAAPPDAWRVNSGEEDLFSHSFPSSWPAAVPSLEISTTPDIFVFLFFPFFLGIVASL